MASARDGCAPVSLELRSGRMRAKVAPSASPRLRGRPERVPSPPPGQTRAHAEQSGGHPRRKADGGTTELRDRAAGCGAGEERVPWWRPAAGPAWHSATHIHIHSPPLPATHSQFLHLDSRGGGGKKRTKRQKFLRKGAASSVAGVQQQESFQRKTTIKWGAAGSATACPLLILNTAHF